MNYYIKIFKLVKNEEYEAQMREWEDKSRYGRLDDPSRPQHEITKPALEVMLTEEEFNKIKKSVLEVM